MTFENMDTEFEPGTEEAGPPPEESSNRPFLIVASILGGIMLLSLLCIVAFALARPMITGGANRQTQAAEINLQNTSVAHGVSLTAVALQWTATSPPTLPPTVTETPAPTHTLVVAQAATNTPSPTTDPRTATVAALLTQAAQAQTTPEAAATPTQLPTTGFADDVGAPGLLGMAVLLIGIIFLSRRLRTAH
jgi:LPXTG-motif cell wall-anchored protein